MTITLTPTPCGLYVATLDLPSRTLASAGQETPLQAVEQLMRMVWRDER